MKKDHCVVLLMHGSKRPSSAREAQTLVERLNRDFETPRVFAAFLQFCPPSLEDVLEKCRDLGFARATVLPLFVLTGSHVETDIPEMVAAFRRRHPAMPVDLKEHLMADESWLTWLQEKVRLTV